MSGLKKSERAIVGGFLVALCALAAALYATRYMRLSYDSMRYAAVADQLRGGAGLRTPLFYMSDSPDASGTIPYTVQPPLFPVLLSVMGGISPDRLWPARVINVLAHIVACLFAFQAINMPPTIKDVVLLR